MGRLAWAGRLLSLPFREVDSRRAEWRMDYSAGSVQDFAAMFNQPVTVLNSVAHVGNIGLYLLCQLSSFGKVLPDVVVHNLTL